MINIVSAVAARVEPITIAELHTQLIAHEQRLEMHNGGSQSSVNLAAKGKGGRGNFGRGGRTGGNSGGRNGGRGNRGGFTRGGGNSSGGGHNSFQPGVYCQICGKEGHPAQRCFKRFDSNYNGPPQKSASNATTSSYGVDTNWYMDTGATDHITGDLERLSFCDKYNGGEQVHAANGSGMDIMHIGHSTLRSPSSNLRLNRVLHVPQEKTNLLSVHRFTNDNNVFVEFHPHQFFVKEEETRRTLLKGRCEGGLYPLRSSSNKSSFNKQVLSVTRPTTSLWHNRLGHASSQVVQSILSRHKISFISDSNKGHVCNACQQGKAHQFPYSRSTNISAKPFDLIY
jgi:histone deacetylase 1/2